MMWPFDRASHRVSLSIQEDAHSVDTSVASHQELAFSRYDGNIRIWYKAELRRVNLCDGQDFGERRIGEIDQSVGVRIGQTGT